VLRQFELKTVGLNPLHARMAQNLVPTLVESFALTGGRHLRRVSARLPQRHGAR
jgi:hypothetical protein